VVVDTHVRRVSQRLALTKNDDPEKIETDLMALAPQKEWYDLGNMLIWHGRKICDARKPKCPDCVLIKQCPSAEQFLQKKH
jgi:endonuclease-3